MAGHGKQRAPASGKDGRGRFVKGHSYGPAPGEVRNPEGARAKARAQERRELFAAEIRRQLEAEGGAALEAIVSNTIRLALTRSKQGGATALRAFEVLAARVDGLPTQRLEHEGGLHVIEELIVDSAGRAPERRTAAHRAGATPPPTTDLEIDPDAV